MARLFLSSQNGENYTIMVGVDSHSLVNQYLSECTIILNGVKYTEKIINNCAFFVLKDIPNDYEGTLDIKVAGPDVPTNFSGSNDNKILKSFSRTLVNGGTADAKRHHCFLIVDEDFDGIEDAYDDNITDLDIEWESKLISLNITDGITDEIAVHDNKDISNVNLKINNEENETSEIVVQTENSHNGT